MITAWAIYLIWAFATLGWLFIAILQGARKRFSKLNFLILLPLATLALFSYVFIFNEGSSVAQFTDRKDLWSLWFECYIPLFFGNAIGTGALLIFLLVPIFWKKMRGTVSWPIKLLMLGSMVLSMFHVLRNMPDC